MKVIEIRCPNCGGTLTPPSSGSTTVCPFCGAPIYLEDNSQKHSFVNAEQAGYEFEKGRQRAMQENQYQTIPPVPGQRSAAYSAPYAAPKKKSHLGWWIFGWLFFFPIPLSIVIWKTDKLKTTTKIILLVLLWAFLLIYGKANG